MLSIDKRTWIDLQITERCNLQCGFCGQAQRERRGQTLDPARLKFFFNSISGIGRLSKTVYIWGGEPLLHNSWKEIVVCASQAGHYTMLNTNGTMFTREIIFAAKRAGLNAFVISIDGPCAYHNNIRKCRNLYEQIFHALPVIYDREIDLYVNCCLIPPFPDQLLSMAADIFERGHAKSLAFNLPLFITSHELNNFANLKLNNKYLEGFTDVHRYFPRVNHSDVDRLLVNVQPVLDKYGELVRVPWPTGAPVDWIMTHFSQDSSLNPLWCHKIEESINVSCDGSIVSCPDIPDESVSFYDSFSKPLFEVGLSRISNQFQHQPKPWCRRCCHARWEPCASVLGTP